MRYWHNLYCYKLRYMDSDVSIGQSMLPTKIYSFQDFHVLGQSWMIISLWPIPMS